MIEHAYAVLMAGGAGTRFWPLSRRKRPKQVLPIADDRPMIRATVDRLGGEIPPDRILVVTGEDQREALASCLPEVPPENFLLEPVPRNTAPCIGLAATAALSRDKEAVLLCLPADHSIRPDEQFRQSARRALERADSAGTLLTFGIVPTHPATGYGYIRQGRELEPGLHKVRRFTEKPGKKKARRFKESGDYRWNSGMFAWRADAFLAEVAAHLPDLAEGLKEIGDDFKVLDEVFPRLPSISVDYGIMEKTALAEVLDADFEWDDVGSFEALARLVPRDAGKNHAAADLLAVHSKKLIAVAPEGHLVAALGVKNLIVVVTADATLVCHRRDAEKVKELVERLQEHGRGELR